MADRPLMHLPGTPEPQESGTQTPHWTLYSFPAMATGRGAWNRGSFFHDSGTQMLGIKVWTGPCSQRLQGRVFPVSFSFWGALGLWPHHPSPSPPSHGYFLPPCLSIKTQVALLCCGLILTASTETRFPNKVPSLWGYHSAPNRFLPGTWGFICPWFVVWKAGVPKATSLLGAGGADSMPSLPPLPPLGPTRRPPALTERQG